MNKISEIINAWAVSFNPTPEQRELAEKRYEICLGCEHYGKSRPITGDEYCKKCLCPIQKKVYTQKLKDTCPLKKWEIVEKEFKDKEVKKNKQTLI
jgi:hypothetical protein